MSNWWIAQDWDSLHVRDKRQWTCPEALLREPSAVTRILSIDMLTEGEITSGSVADLMIHLLIYLIKFIVSLQPLWVMADCPNFFVFAILPIRPARVIQRAFVLPLSIRVRRCFFRLFLAYNS